MVLEKITLQKCLLYFESLHGRPVSPLQSMAPPLARMKNTWETIKQSLTFDPNNDGHHTSHTSAAILFWGCS